jgi:glycosyltransferase involved in cell wall biosynthesis
MPKLTIGLPVYNGAASLRPALDSLLSQTFTDFVLIISDNASQDATAEICTHYSARDSRVCYLRRPQTSHVFENARSVLMAANTPYFMWTAHDDVWEPEFAERNIANLERNLHAVGSVSKVCWISPDGSKSIAYGSHQITGSTDERLREYLCWPDDNCRYYSVFRTMQLQKCFPESNNFFACDHLVMALSLMEGEHLEYPEILLTRRGQESDHYYKNFRLFEPKWYEWVFPLHRLNRELHQRLPKELWRAIRWRLLLLNAKVCLDTLEVHIPKARLLLKPLRAVGKTVAPNREPNTILEHNFRREPPITPSPD